MHSKSTKQRRVQRVRAKIYGETDCPRLSVFRSNKHIYAQLIDDAQGKTVAAARDSEVKGDGDTKIVKAGKIGELLGQKASKLKVTKVRFDRGPYAYHGQVKALADGARKGGLVF